MQSSLIRLAFPLSRRSLAWLTLCAIGASSSTAQAQSSAAPDPVASLVGSLTDDDAADTAPGVAQVAPIPDEKGTGGAPTSMVTAFGLASLGLPTLPLASAAAPLEQGSASAPAQADANEGAGLRTAGFVAGGVGLAGLALFAIAGLGAKSTYDKLNSDCGNTPCTDEAHRSDIEGGRMLQTTANIGLALGLTGLGVGATLLVLGSRSSDERRGPSASVSANGGMITYGGYF